MTRDTAGRTAPYTLLVWFGCGNVLLALHLALLALSRQFIYGEDMRQRPIVWLVVLLMSAAVVYFVPLLFVRRTVPTRTLLLWVVLLGAALRLVYFPSQAMQEDDFYRYLWDGGKVAHGWNPYGHRPEDVALGMPQVPRALYELGQASGRILERVNHPHLGTIYPPVAQAVFALAHLIAPWSFMALKAVFLAIDFAALGLLLIALRQLGRSPLWATAYWWNPLLIKEAYNSGHMDVLLVPLLLGAFVLVARRQIVAAMLPLAGAVAVKVWPILLLPLFLCPRWPHRMRIAGAGLVFGVAAAALLAPMLGIRALGGDSGVVQYSMRWEMNDALFMVFPWAASHIGTWLEFDWDARTTHRIGRLVAAGLAGLVALAVALRRDTRPQAIASGALVASTALLLVSPTQFPWYYYWVAPFLALRPSPGVLSMTLMLPVYYLKFHYDARGQIDFFHYTVVWFEWLPVWLVLAGELLWRGRRPARPTVPRPSAAA